MHDDDAASMAPVLAYLRYSLAAIIYISTLKTPSWVVPAGSVLYRRYLGDKTLQLHVRDSLTLNYLDVFSVRAGSVLRIRYKIKNQEDTSEGLQRFIILILQINAAFQTLPAERR